MKKTIISLAFLIGLYFNSSSQDLVPGALSYNYDFLTAVLSNISITIDNTGSSRTFSSVTVDVYIVDIGSGACLVSSSTTDGFGISAGGSETIQVPNIDIDATCNPPTATYYFEVEVDVNDDETETNENNNIKTYSNDGFYFEQLGSASIDEKDQLSINVYPNPAKDFITISANETSSNLSFSLLSYDGKVVKSGVLESSKQLNTSELTKGIYSLLVSSENKTITKKIIIQ